MPLFDHLAAAHTATAAFTSALVTFIAVTCKSAIEQILQYEHGIQSIEIKQNFTTSVKIKNKTEDGSKYTLTIDFIADTTSLTEQWVASVSCGTPEIKIDYVFE